MKDKLLGFLDKIDDDRDLECHERIKEFMCKNGFNSVAVSVDEMFDSPGYDVYSVSVAWIENGEVQLAVGSIGID